MNLQFVYDSGAQCRPAGIPSDALVKAAKRSVVRWEQDEPTEGRERRKKSSFRLFQLFVSELTFRRYVFVDVASYQPLD